MSNYVDKLKKLNATYQKTAGHKPSGFMELPKGTYQLEIKEIKVVPESKAPFAKGELEIQLRCQVLTGGFKGAWGRINYFLEQPSKVINGKEMPSGLALFKGFLEAAGFDLPQLTEKALVAVLRELKGFRFNGYCTGKGNNIYFNSSLDGDDITVSEEDLTEDSEEETEESTEETEEVEEETEEVYAPPKKLKASDLNKKPEAKKKPAPVEEEEAEEADDDLDFDL